MAQMAEGTDSQTARAPARSEEMNPDVLLTIAFVFYAVVGAAAAGLLIARSRRDTVVDQAAESRLNGFSKGAVARRRPR
jgi:hypothetical protein